MYHAASFILSARIPFFFFPRGVLRTSTLTNTILSLDSKKTSKVIKKKKKSCICPWSLIALRTPQTFCVLWYGPYEYADSGVIGLFFGSLRKQIFVLPKILSSCQFNPSFSIHD